MALVRTDGTGRIVALTIPEHSMFPKETVVLAAAIAF